MYRSTLIRTHVYGVYAYRMRKRFFNYLFLGGHLNKQAMQKTLR